MYDVAIIGGGPAGLSAALMLGRCRRRVVVIDSGKPRNAAARTFHGFLGRDHTNPASLLEQGRREIEHYGVELVQDTATAAESVRSSELKTCFEVRTERGRSFQSRKLLFATGMRDELPTWPGVDVCYGVTVHHCPYCDGWEHRDAHLIAYGTTTAAALGLGELLRNWSDRVTALTDGQELESVERARAQACGIAVNAQPISALMHEEGRLQQVHFQNGDYLAADALFFSTGRRPHCELPMDLGCEWEEEGTLRTRPKQRTNVPGLYLAGDADGDVQFVINAAAEGATAAIAIHRELQDEDSPARDL